MRTLLLVSALPLLLVACDRSGREPTSSTSGHAEGRHETGERAPGIVAPGTPTRTEPEHRQPPPPTPAPTPTRGPIVRIETSMGVIRVQLDEEHAPQTVQNFLQYVQDHFYDGTIFHRVIQHFMIQGGGFTPDLVQKPTRAPIPLEISPALRHIDGAIAMARTSDPNSANAQFYICDGPQHRLDDGYAPFGHVIEGMDVVRAIASVQTGSRNGMSDVPVQDVVIVSVTRE